MCTTGVNDTGGKSAAGINYTGGKLPPVSTTPGKNLLAVSRTPVANSICYFPCAQYSFPLVPPFLTFSLSFIAFPFLSFSLPLFPFHFLFFLFLSTLFHLSFSLFPQSCSRAPPVPHSRLQYIFPFPLASVEQTPTLPWCMVPCS
jgi:hypothetical protein